MLKEILRLHPVKFLFLLSILFSQSHSIDKAQLQKHISDYSADINKRCIDISLKSERMFYTYGKAPIFIVIGGSCAGKSFISKKVSKLLSDSTTSARFKSFISDKELRDSGLSKINKKIGIKEAIVDFFPTTIEEAVQWCISNGDFKSVVKSNLANRFQKDEASRIFNAFTKYLTDDFEAASVADFAIDYSRQGIGTFVDHIHKYSDLILFKQMLELKLFRAEIIPFFIPNTFQELIKRSTLRNIEAAQGKVAPRELRFSSRPCKEFFKNITTSPTSTPLYKIDKTNFLATIDILKERYFPVLIEELKPYINQNKIDLEAEAERIHKESITTIETFFGPDSQKTVYFNGGNEVIIMNTENILYFIKKYYRLLY